MRLTPYFQFLFILFLTGFTLNSNGQQKLSTVQQQSRQRNYYRKVLQVDSLKAAQVAQVQDSYKAELHALIVDTTLSEGARRSRIGILIERKNQKLRGLLTPAQQEKIIPTSERVSPAVKSQ